MRVLVAIANHGTKNAAYLNKLLEEYRSMKKYKVDIVVLSNIPKDLGSDIEVIVGLPAKDPWSLPFGHKSLFADRIQRYDLFIYSEDDTLITERNIDAFVRVTPLLPDRYIAGFIRHEIVPNGRKYYSTIHSGYHWDPDSVLKTGEYIFAHYTNEHSACFILTHEQLGKAIDSGGFLLPPRTGRYDMLVTAATDPYTQCGMKKLVCVSHLEDFCLHHLPNAYCGEIGHDSELADREIERLMSLHGTEKIRGPLFETVTMLEDASWDKKYYESSRSDVLSLIQEGVQRVLSIGCGCGSTESELVRQGIEVVGIPLDAVIQASSEARGIRVVPPCFETAIEMLCGEEFDAILFVDVLQHLPDPVSILAKFQRFLRRNGSIVISVPNFKHPSVIRRSLSGRYSIPPRSERRAFSIYRLHFTDRRMLNSWLKKSCLKPMQTCHRIEQRFDRIRRITFGAMDSFLSRDIVVLTKSTYDIASNNRRNAGK
jgi:2-polyprenyl-3-methyl-5-hydroxy-6-metoxy-1,4-benzoquinol methylase